MNLVDDDVGEQGDVVYDGQEKRGEGGGRGGSCSENECCLT